jgi:predicted transcriptional regulator
MSKTGFSDRAYTANDAGIAMAMGELMLAHLRRIYQTFDGDLMLAMILAEIAHYNVKDLVRGERFRNADIAAYVAENRLKPVNTLSLSQSCSIPRETLRRKIRKLVEAGLIQKYQDGSLHITEQCMARFGPDFNKALLKDIRTCAARLEGLLDEGGV